MGSVRVRRGGEHGNGDSLQWGQVHSGKGRMNMGVMRKDKGEAGGGGVWRRGGGQGPSWKGMQATGMSHDHTEREETPTHTGALHRL